ncbi:hypothetical protein [Imhoffiella purpurea]|uniref:DUF560 domain-containing protein n=1 Tax=Imhoffiella purpurea TaxID=1249627 RepID=W9VWW8_9GAMM|nr:hypothetical protein [Imhoffiella purpurea]EXJ14905.1 hypothetical protein D779_2111 [Imhoffiella purpurea]
MSARIPPRRLARQTGRAALSLLLCASMLLPIQRTHASDLELSGETGLGYDTNPAQSHRSRDLAFARLALGAAQTLGLKTSDLSFALEGWYRDYEADNDSYRLSLGSSWSRSTERDLGLIRVSVSGVLYRDALVPADERDEAALALRYDRILGARDTLGLSAEVRWLAYRNPSEPWSGRPGSGSGRWDSNGRGRGTGRQGSGRPTARLEQRRDDRLSTLALDAAHDWSPTVSTRITLAHARNESPVALESYDRDGIGLLARIALGQKWLVEAGLGWSRCDYDHAQRRLSREDEQRSAALAIRRQLGARELYCSLDWVDSDSTLDDRSFRQGVTQCGLAWSF